MYEEEIISKYRMFLNEKKKLTENTINLYVNDGKKLLTFLIFANIDIKNINSKTLNEFKKYLTFHNYKSSSIKRIMYSIRSFICFLFEYKIIKNDFSKEIKVEISNQKAKDKIKTEQFEEIISKIDIAKLNGMRDEVFLRILAQTTLDVDEVLNLKIENINFEIKTLSYKNTSFNIDEKLIEKIKLYFNRLFLINYKSNSNINIFQSSFGDKLTRQAMLKNFKRYINRTDFDFEINFRNIKNLDKK